MDIVLTQQHPPVELEAHNRCCTYLQVTTLVEITMFYDRTIHDETFSAPVDDDD
jgi:hypothetical protein